MSSLDLPVNIAIPRLIVQNILDECLILMVQNVDVDHIYCSSCLDIQMKLGDKGHLSQVSSFAATTSTGNLNLHLSQKHDIFNRSQKKCTKILGYLKKHKDDQPVGGTSKHEIARNMTLWFCHDLLPFDLVQKDGFLDFFKKMFPVSAFNQLIHLELQL